MGQYMPRLAAICLSSVESRSRPQLCIALSPHRLAAASGRPAAIAFTVMATIGAPIPLAAGLASSYSAHTYYLTDTANWYHGSSTLHGHCSQCRNMFTSDEREFLPRAIDIN